MEAIFAKARVRLCDWTGLLEPTLFAYMIIAHIEWVSSFALNVAMSALSCFENVYKMGKYLIHFLEKENPKKQQNFQIFNEFSYSFTDQASRSMGGRS